MSKVEGLVTGLMLTLPVWLFVLWRLLGLISAMGAASALRMLFAPSRKDNSWWSRRYFEREDRRG